MEAAILQAPDLRLNSLIYDNDPSRFLRGINYLDPEDPIDGVLVDLKQALTTENLETEDEYAEVVDNLPTARQQLSLVRGLQANDLQSAHALIDSHQWLIAAVAYPFKGQGVDSADLLHLGARAVIRAAKTFDTYTYSVDFNDYLATAIHQAFSSERPDLAGDSFVESQEYPMENIYCFAETLELADTPGKMRMKKAIEAERLSTRLNPKEMEVLQLLHLPNDEIGPIIGVSTTIISRRLASIKQKLGVETREAAAVRALSKGIVYDVPDIPERESFTIRQRQIAMRLIKPDTAIMEELGLSREKLRKSITKLFKATKARTRSELALMAHMNNFEPSEEELNPPPPSFLEQFSPLQKDIFGRMLYMDDPEIEDELGVSVGTIHNMANRAVKKAGVANRTELLLELHRHGMKFDVIKPEVPIVETLNSHEIEVIQHLHLSYEEIADIFGYDSPANIGNIVFRARKKVGARTRHELALLVDMIDDPDEAFQVDYSTNRWRLSRRLGLKTLAACNIDEVLLAAREREQEIIAAYYLGERAVSLIEVSKELDITRNAARMLASSGTARMRRELKRLETDPVQLSTRKAA